MTKLSKKDLYEINQWSRSDQLALIKIGDGQGRPVKIDNINTRLNLDYFINVWHLLDQGNRFTGAHFYCTLTKKGEAAYKLFVEA